MASTNENHSNSNSKIIRFSIEQAINLPDGMAEYDQYKVIPMSWVQDGSDLRIDINLPTESQLNLTLPGDVKNLFVNGETIRKDFEQIAGIYPQFSLEHNESDFIFISNEEGALHILVQFEKLTK